MVRALVLMIALLGASSYSASASDCNTIVASFCFQIPPGMTVVKVQPPTPNSGQSELVETEVRTMGQVSVVMRVGAFRSNSGRTLREYVDHMYRNPNNQNRELLTYAEGKPHTLIEMVGTIPVAGMICDLSVADYKFSTFGAASFNRQKGLISCVLPDGKWLLIRWWNRADVPLASYINSLTATARIVPPSS